MLEIIPVATQASLTAIKDGRFVNVVGMGEPIPVLAENQYTITMTYDYDNSLVGSLYIHIHP